MFLKRFPTGIISENCYIIGDAGEGAVIDPGVETADIVKVLDEQKLSLKYILLTHAHLDHILNMEKLRDTRGGKIVIHEEDAGLLGDPAVNGASLFGLNTVFGEADIKVREGDILKLGGLELEILHTPGHTPGSMCIKAGDNIFTGDTLFRMGVGRTDLGAGDHDKLMSSLKKLMELDDSTKVYPGHGSVTDIGYERRNNTSLWY